MVCPGKVFGECCTRICDPICYFRGFDFRLSVPETRHMNSEYCPAFQTSFALPQGCAETESTEHGLYTLDFSIREMYNESKMISVYISLIKIRGPCSHTMTPCCSGQLRNFIKQSRLHCGGCRNRFRVRDPCFSIFEMFQNPNSSTYSLTNFR